jgi:alpha-amylase/alpha-mannosidase (GH57 family)
MERYLCIHGHFYQPPRENPWLEAIELQDSAFPYHDWNERITAECYAPNATARKLDGDGRILDIVNNYSGISFNFGPTLLAWMQERAPDVLAAIIEADKQSRERFSGHGSALAQAYNHMILPLANPRDKATQVRWGIRDFEHRFGRKPEGMWLAETVADTPSLEVLAEHAIKFTILSPFQASRVRPLKGGQWTDVNGGRVDPSRPYLVRLPSKRSVAVFFYDAPVSKAVAFEQLLNSGEGFASRLMDGFDDGRQWDQLVHIATDGESYGHHHRYGEMALAHALHHIETSHLAKLTNYGEFLEQHPPVMEAQIHEKSAWSCSHGVGRWFADCGCNSGGRPGWHQRWRAPLREALDWLRDTLAPRFELKAAELLQDPWAARDDYISVILDRSDESVAAYFQRHAKKPLDEEQQVTVLRLMELQRHAMLMYTSCGWFF